MMEGNVAIHTHELTKRFGQFTAVDRIGFEVKRGEVFGFLGANGAGKTTAIRMLCGLLTPTSGSANVAGYDVFTQRGKIKRNIGYMSQKFSLYANLTARENMLFYGGIYGLNKHELKEKVDALIRELGVSEYMDQPVYSLPLGWKQKIAFSTAILHNPRVVFLDEPTGGVDPITRRQFWDLIRATAERDITVFVTTHYMDEAEYCDRVCVMVDGAIAALDSPSELKSHYGVNSMDGVFLQLARNAKRVE
ncbi:MAG TPA: ABC transporter ATP-binding protein [Saprospiraceae bacterium]|nr:ABC transporter ATP-binding protein [Saprospiraceae bacterium]